MRTTDMSDIRQSSVHIPCACEQHLSVRVVSTWNREAYARKPTLSSD